jgi:hypothetical protein
MNRATNRSVISVCITKDAGTIPPNAEHMGLGVSPIITKGQRIGLYGWFVISNKTWEIFPRKTDKMRTEEKLHLLRSSCLSILNRLPIRGGNIKIVNTTERDVPMVAAPSRLWSTSRSGTPVPSSKITKGISRSGNIEPTISPGRLNLSLELSL